MGADIQTDNSVFLEKNMTPMQIAYIMVIPVA